MSDEKGYNVKFDLTAGYPLYPCRSLTLRVDARNGSSAIGKAYGHLHYAGIDPEKLHDPVATEVTP